MGDDLWPLCEQSRQRPGCRVVEESSRGAQLQQRTFQIRTAAERFWVTPKSRLVEGCGLGRSMGGCRGHPLGQAFQRSSRRWEMGTQ